MLQRKTAWAEAIDQGEMLGKRGLWRRGRGGVGVTGKGLNHHQFSVAVVGKHLRLP